MTIYTDQNCKNGMISSAFSTIIKCPPPSITWILLSLGIGIIKSLLPCMWIVFGIVVVLSQVLIAWAAHLLNWGLVSFKIALIKVLFFALNNLIAMKAGGWKQNLGNRGIIFNLPIKRYNLGNCSFVWAEEISMVFLA